MAKFIPFLFLALGGLQFLAGVFQWDWWLNFNSRARNNGWVGTTWYRIYTICIGLLLVGFGVYFLVT